MQILNEQIGSLGCRDPGHDVDVRATDGSGVVDGLTERPAKVGLASGKTAQPPFTSGPIAGRGIDQNNIKIIILKPVCYIGSLEFIGKQELNTLETGLRRAIEAFKKIDFGEQPTQIGG